MGRGIPGESSLAGVRDDNFGFSVLHSLSSATDGKNPVGKLIQGFDGRLYGATTAGGPAGGGTIFAINADGTGYAVLHALDPTTEGYNSYGGVIQGRDGRLYGTTYYGTASTRDGVIYTVGTDGSGFRLLHVFNISKDGGNIGGALMQGTDGRLYGTASQGGYYDYGTIFSMEPDGTDFTVLHSMQWAADGGNPNLALMQGADGRLYGAAGQGGPNNSGTIFAINTDGSGYTVLRYLDSYADGSVPYCPLVQGPDGKLYGSTALGTPSYGGSVFSINTDGSGFAMLHSFQATEGTTPTGLTLGRDGRIYGVTNQNGVTYGVGGGSVFAMRTDGSGFAVLYTLASATDGQTPYGLCQGDNGNLYAATEYGGANGDGALFALPNTSPAAARLTNLSTRAMVGTGSNILIPGFYISGAGTETLLIRGDGPSLASLFSVAGALAQPSLAVFNGSQVQISQNTGWTTSASAAQIAAVSSQVGAFALPSGSADSAVIVTLNPGPYTAQVSGVGGTTGIALAEIYEVSHTGTARLANISTRAMVGTGANILIPGFYISGSGTETLLIRGDGPSLGTLFNLSGALAKPSLAVLSGSQAQILQNTGWSTSANAAQISGVAVQVGAFALPAASSDSAVIVTLPPGSYTAQVSGVDSTTGVGLAEIYEVP